MVTRVYGKANNAEIIFTHIKGDRWETTVPWTADGEYIVELMADDEAGNTAYVCSVLFVVSGHEFNGYIIPRGYSLTETKNCDYSGLANMQDYFGDIVKGGFSIERQICCRNDT